jgi:tetratricopeptide (TPR) repeat protein
MDWLMWAAGAQLDYAATLMRSGQLDEAAAQTRAGCDRVDRLSAQGGDVAQWKSVAVQCLMRRAQVAMTGGSEAEALALANRALAAARARRTGAPIERAVQVAQMYKLIGDIRHRAGEASAAQAAWQTALAKWPKGLDDPRNTALRAELLTALGRGAEARPLTSRLEAMGYRTVL